MGLIGRMTAFGASSRWSPIDGANALAVWAWLVGDSAVGLNIRFPLCE